MYEDSLDYPRFIQDALRSGVLRRSLEVVSREGLPGDHHFYISFRTDYPGVIVSATLQDMHPEEMTVVVQHQFRNLEVEEDLFSIELWFGGVAHRLVIPFAAVTAFADPSVNLQLAFAMESPAESGDEAAPEADEDEASKEGEEARGDAKERGAKGSDDKGSEDNKVVSFAEFRDKAGRSGS